MKLQLFSWQIDENSWRAGQRLVHTCNTFVSTSQAYNAAILEASRRETEAISTIYFVIFCDEIFNAWDVTGIHGRGAISRRFSHKLRVHRLGDGGMVHPFIAGHLCPQRIALQHVLPATCCIDLRNALWQVPQVAWILAYCDIIDTDWHDHLRMDFGWSLRLI